MRQQYHKKQHPAEGGKRKDLDALKMQAEEQSKVIKLVIEHKDKTDKDPHTWPLPQPEAVATARPQVCASACVSFRLKPYNPNSEP